MLSTHVKDSDLDKCAIVGDVNLFLKRNNEDHKEGELSIMLAEKSSQRKGLA